MIEVERLCIDTNSVIELLREGSVAPSLFPRARRIALPLPALGELLTGAYSSRRTQENLLALNKVTSAWTLLAPDEETAHVYGRLRTIVRDMPRATQARVNDLWIAALCIEHSLPLLTNDGGFDVMPGLTVIHW
jgi:tRNA(fMet)-specific endonuclease VapC